MNQRNFPINGFCISNLNRKLIQEIGYISSHQIMANNKSFHLQFLQNPIRSEGSTFINLSPFRMEIWNTIVFQQVFLELIYNKAVQEEKSRDIGFTIVLLFENDWTYQIHIEHLFWVVSG